MGLLNKFRKQKKATLEKEIADHLTTLFNTKRSFGAWQAGYGIGDYANYHAKTDLVKEMIQDIRFNIENYEKRVQLVEVVPVETPNTCSHRFVIKCKLGSRFHSFYIGFKKGKDPIEVEF
jgi:predicted component of type VI protein secretion system